MVLTSITSTEFQSFADTISNRSFIQSEQMGVLLGTRGADVTYLALKEDAEILVAALVYTLPMTGGLHMEINCGPIYSDSSYLEAFYNCLKEYAKSRGVLQLIVKPYDTYQTFDSSGQPSTEEQKEIISTLTNLGFQHDGLMTGYPGGEPDWLYLKNLAGITEKTLLTTFSKKGKSLVKKANTFGIKLKKLQREELVIFKKITTKTSERRNYSDKSLEYYQHFYDSFKDKAEFIIATLNFNEYLNRLEIEQDKLQAKIEKIKTKLLANPNSDKIQNTLREYNSQFDSFELRKTEAKELAEKYGDEDVVLAASLFVYMSQEVTYLFSGSYSEFSKFYAPTILQEYVMLECIKRGIPSYNLLGIQGLFDGSDGVLRFKQNFNGYIVRKPGTFRYYPNPFKFKCLQVLKKLMGR